MAPVLSCISLGLSVASLDWEVPFPLLSISRVLALGSYVFFVCLCVHAFVADVCSVVR